MTYSPKNVLVTGGAGFIGSFFILRLIQNPSIRITNLDALTYAGNLENLTELKNHERYQFVHGSILDAPLVESLLQKNQIDTIVHFAAESHVDRSIEGPLEFVKTNVLGTVQLLECARKSWHARYQLNPTACRFHHISTDEVFGTLGLNDTPFTETTPYAPNSPYSASKAGSDHFVRAYANTYGLPTTLSNCSNNYGPHQHPEKLIPTIIRTALAHQPIPIYGTGKNIRDWLYVEDHCEAIEKIIRHGALGECYAIGGDCELTNLELAHHLCTILDQKFPQKKSYKDQISYVTDRAGHDFRYAIDSKKIEQKLGFKPRTSLNEGLEKTVAYYTKHLDQ